MTSPSRRVLIAGGGPAGLLAGLAAARGGARVTIFEKNNTLGRKLAISGGGRANLTNVGDHRHIADAFGRDGRFLYSALTRFDNDSLVRLLAEIGVQVKVEDHGRIFPVTDSAKSVVDAMERALLSLGVEIRMNSAVAGLVMAAKAEGAGELPVVKGLRIGPDSVMGDAVIVTTGGISFPKTGATGDAFPWLADLGHTTAPLKPGLAPLLTPRESIAGLQGLSLREIRLTLFVNGKKAGAELWDLMFAHFGLTGPAPLSLSHLLPPKAAWQPCWVELDYLPKLDGEEVRNRLRALVARSPAKHVGNLLVEMHLPARYADFLADQSGAGRERRASTLGPDEIEKLALALKKFRIEVTGPGPMDGAMVTAGGIALSEIDGKTLQSRKARHLWVAGEILNLAAKSGGYNLQAAWTTGWVAGESAANLAED